MTTAAPKCDMSEVRLVETCSACPTQYDVFLPDGRELYFRYRWARWSLQLDGPAGPGIEGKLEGRPGGQYDGVLEPAEVRELLEWAIPEVLAWVDFLLEEGR